MMQSFNSTTRLYKDILHLLENEALRPHDNEHQRPRETRLPDAQLSAPSLHSCHQHSRNAWSSPETDMPEPSDGVTPIAELPCQSHAALSFSYVTRKRSVSRTYPTSPKTGISRYSTLSSRLESSDRSQLSTTESGGLLSATSTNMNMKEPEPPEMPRAIRPVSSRLSLNNSDLFHSDSWLIQTCALRFHR